MTEAVLLDILRERQRQNAKWGEQHHPNGTPAFVGVMALSAYDARAAKRMCDIASKHGSVTWAHIAWEEVAEAFEEQDDDKLEIEVIQCAAVFAAWAEDIRSRRSSAPRVPAEIADRWQEDIEEYIEQPEFGRGSAAP